MQEVKAREPNGRSSLKTSLTQFKELVYSFGLVDKAGTMSSAQSGGFIKITRNLSRLTCAPNKVNGGVHQNE